jgi:hypothetical protein
MSATQDLEPITPGLDPKGVEQADSTELEKACTHAVELLDAFLKGEYDAKRKTCRPLAGSACSATCQGY